MKNKFKSSLFVTSGIFIGLLLGSISTFTFLSWKYEKNFSQYLWIVGVSRSQATLELLNYIVQGEIEKAKWKGEDLLYGETTMLKGCLNEECREYGSDFMLESITEIVAKNNAWMDEYGKYSNEDERERYRKYHNDIENRDYGIYTEEELTAIRESLNIWHQQNLDRN